MVVLSPITGVDEQEENNLHPPDYEQESHTNALELTWYIHTHTHTHRLSSQSCLERFYHSTWALTTHMHTQLPPPAVPTDRANMAKLRYRQTDRQSYALLHTMAETHTTHH